MANGTEIKSLSCYSFRHDPEHGYFFTIDYGSYEYTSGPGCSMSAREGIEDEIEELREKIDWLEKCKNQINEELSGDDEELCDDRCLNHAPGCDGYCDHLAGHKNACLDYLR